MNKQERLDNLYKGLKELDDEDKYFNDRVSAGDAKCEDCGEWDLATNCDYDDDTGLHTNCGLCRDDIKDQNKSYE